MTSLNRSQSLGNKPKYNLEAFINKKASYNLSNITILQQEIEDTEKNSALYFNQIMQLDRQIEYIQQKLNNIKDYKVECQNKIKKIFTFNDNIISILTAKNLSNCSICLANIPTNNVAITKCGHMFCKICLSESIRWSNRCPICRKNINIDQVSIVNLDDSKPNDNDDKKEDIINIEAKNVENVSNILQEESVSREHITNNEEEEKREEIEEEKREVIQIYIPREEIEEEKQENPSSRVGIGSENSIQLDYVNEYRVRSNFIIPPNGGSQIRTYNYDIQGRRRRNNNQGYITRYNSSTYDNTYHNERIYNPIALDRGTSDNYDRNLGSGGHGDGGSRSNSEWQRHYLRNPTIDSFRRNRQQNESSTVPSDKR